MVHAQGGADANWGGGTATVAAPDVIRTSAVHALARLVTGGLVVIQSVMTGSVLLFPHSPDKVSVISVVTYHQCMLSEDGELLEALLPRVGDFLSHTACRALPERPHGTFDVVTVCGKLHCCLQCNATL